MIVLILLIIVAFDEGREIFTQVNISLSQSLSPYKKKWKWPLYGSVFRGREMNPALW